MRRGTPSRYAARANLPRFSGTVAGMSFVYGNFDPTGNVFPISDALVAIFSKGGAFTDVVTESGNMNQTATFTYAGPEFDQVDFFFSLGAVLDNGEIGLFTADTFVYEEPEPISLALIGVGLAGLAVAHRRRPDRRRLN